MHPVTAVIYEGGDPRTDIELSMLPIRLAACLDAIEKLKSLPHCFNRVILATNYPNLATEASVLGAEVVFTPTEGFHLGEHLRDLVMQFALGRVFYMTGAGSPLLQLEELQEISTALKNSEELVYVNNVQSVDFVGWVPGSRIALLQELPRFDNSLGHLLKHEGKLPRKLIPHSAGAHYDIDTPTDMQILRFARNCSPRLQKALDLLRWNTDVFLEFWNRVVLHNNNPSLWISGRINGPAIAHCEASCMGRLNIVSEERGMRTLSRQHLVQSFVGHFIQD